MYVRKLKNKWFSSRNNQPMLDTTRLAYYFPALPFSSEYDIRTRLQRLHLRARSAFSSIQDMSRYPLTITDVPPILTDPFIIRGYRSTHQPWSYYWKSLFHKHNESINVWSHLLGILYMGHLFYYYNQRLHFFENAHSWPFVVSLCTATIMFMSSAFAHLLHSKSERIHMTCFSIDYVGVSLHGFGSGFLHIYYSAPQWYYNQIEYQYLFVILFLGILACFSNCFAQYYFRPPYPPLKRVCQFLPCGILWIYSVIPLIICLFPMNFPLNPTSMCHLGQIILFIIGASFFAFDFPQRLWPGALDFIGQGHHLFHLSVYFVTVCQMHGVYWDYEKYQAVIDQRSKPDLIFCAGSMIFLIISDIIIVYLFRRFFPQKHHVHRR
jgi:predicted membrane channel-forming protein YqfA (hemolysin III family)